MKILKFSKIAVVLIALIAVVSGRIIRMSLLNLWERAFFIIFSTILLLTIFSVEHIRLEFGEEELDLS